MCYGLSDHFNVFLMKIVVFKFFFERKLNNISLQKIGWRHTDLSAGGGQFATVGLHVGRLKTVSVEIEKIRSYAEGM